MQVRKIQHQHLTVLARFQNMCFWLEKKANNNVKKNFTFYPVLHNLSKQLFLSEKICMFHVVRV